VSADSHANDASEREAESDSGLSRSSSEDAFSPRGKVDSEEHMDVDDDDCDELSRDREREANCTGGKGMS
jgi:hypothetical protein